MLYLASILAKSFNMVKILALICGLFISLLANGQIFSYADAIAQAAPAIVSIQTSKHIKIENNPLYQDPYYKFFFDQKDLENNIASSKMFEQGLGSGVIIDKQGYILTNYHVITDVHEIIIKLPDGRVSKAKIIGLDQETDLAVLKVNLKNLPQISLGDAEKLRVGDIVLAIGNPFGLNNTVTHGIISAKGARYNANQNIFGAMLDNVLQTDAAINPGNSGGGLIDLNGELIGINTAIVSNSGGSHGIGFAIPINKAQEIMHELIAHGKIIRGWLGVRLNELSPEMRQYLGYHDLHGIYVQATVKNSPAQNFGILPGDILLAIDQHVLKDVASALRLIASLKPGQTCIIKFFREHKIYEYKVIIGNKNAN
jgi:Do/DeqQ family serine protease